MIQIQDHEHVLTQLETLKKASRDLQNNTIFTSNDSHVASIKLLLDLEIKPDSVFSTNLNFFSLNQLLCNLKTLLVKLEKYQGLSSLLHSQIIKYKISQVAYAIEKEIQAYIDRESVKNLVKVLEKPTDDEEEEKEKIEVLIEFVQRLSNGFDGDFQDLILKEKVFSIFERLLDDFTCSKRVRERVSLAIEALVNFNRNVFVGLVLMGPTIQALINMNSSCSIRVLCSLINLIRSPLIDEIHSKGQIPKIIAFLSFNDLSIQVAAMDCICQIAYFGRREVIEEMIKQGVIDKLMELQRSINTTDQNPDDDSLFSSWVLRFAVQVEVGEGLSSSEKIEIKLEILKRVKEASVSEVETATIVAEVLWGSSP
ncbi:hypothetical protein Q3G72_035556 [Acer saccharum]|nr:hypothetical protein Q3G72_035556 [Acer saccharum]